jgi:hypothetical protein
MYRMICSSAILLLALHAAAYDSCMGSNLQKRLVGTIQISPLNMVRMPPHNSPYLCDNSSSDLDGANARNRTRKNHLRPLRGGNAHPGKDEPIGLRGYQENKALVEEAIALVNKGCSAPQDVLRGFSNLAALAAGRESAERVAEADGVHAIVHAMRADPENYKVQARGCATLFVFCRDARGRLRLSSLGGVNLVLDAMRLCTYHGAVAAESCMLLKRLSSEPVTRGVIAKEGGIEATVAACRTHPCDAAVQKAACEALQVSRR